MSDKIYRAGWHDYTERCIYMLTLKKSPHIPDFGTLCGDWRIPCGSPGAPYVSASPLGRVIKRVLRSFFSTEPHLRLDQYALMPDHLHLLVFVTEKTEEILGRIMARFKSDVNAQAGMTGIFLKGINDQILTSSRSLDALYHYLRDNPRRLAVRRALPEFFRRVNAMEIGGRVCQVYGNFQLLDNPFKDQVVVHRADSAQTRSQNRNRWLYTAANGGVLVSPFISPDEKAIRAEAEEAGGRLILVTNGRMEERYKPSGRDFALCEQGRLLIVATGTGGSLSRSDCLAMNKLAAAIADPAFPSASLR